MLEELGRAVAPVPFLTSSVIATSLLLTRPAVRQAQTVGRARLRRNHGRDRNPASRPDQPRRTRSTIDAAGRVTGRVRSVAGALEADDLLVPVATPAGTAIFRVCHECARAQPGHVVGHDPTTRGHHASTRSQASSSSPRTAPPRRPRTDDGCALLASEQMGVAGWCLTTTVDVPQAAAPVRPSAGQLPSAEAPPGRHCSSRSRRRRRPPTTPRPPWRPTTRTSRSPRRSRRHGAVTWRCVPRRTAIQLHGGIGMTWEHPAHLYLKRAKADQIALGRSGYHRARLAELVDLPGTGRLTEPLSDAIGVPHEHLVVVPVPRRAVTAVGKGAWEPKVRP